MTGPRAAKVSTTSTFMSSEASSCPGRQAAKEGGGALNYDEEDGETASKPKAMGSFQSAGRGGFLESLDGGMGKKVQSSTRLPSLLPLRSESVCLCLLVVFFSSSPVALALFLCWGGEREKNSAYNS